MQLLSSLTWAAHGKQNGRQLTSCVNQAATPRPVWSVRQVEYTRPLFPEQKPSSES